MPIRVDCGNERFVDRATSNINAATSPVLRMKFVNKQGATPEGRFAEVILLNLARSNRSTDRLAQIFLLLQPTNQTDSGQHIPARYLYSARQMQSQIAKQLRSKKEDQPLIVENLEWPVLQTNDSTTRDKVGQFSAFLFQDLMKTATDHGYSSIIFRHSNLANLDLSQAKCPIHFVKCNLENVRTPDSPSLVSPIAVASPAKAVAEVDTALEPTLKVTTEATPVEAISTAVAKPKTRDPLISAEELNAHWDVIMQIKAGSQLSDVQAKSLHILYGYAMECARRSIGYLFHSSPKKYDQIINRVEEYAERIVQQLFLDIFNQSPKKDGSPRPSRTKYNAGYIWRNIQHLIGRFLCERDDKKEGKKDCGPELNWIRHVCLISNLATHSAPTPDFNSFIERQDRREREPKQALEDNELLTMLCRSVSKPRYEKLVGYLSRNLDNDIPDKLRRLSTELRRELSQVEAIYNSGEPAITQEPESKITIDPEELGDLLTKLQKHQQSIPVSEWLTALSSRSKLELMALSNSHRQTIQFLLSEYANDQSPSYVAVANLTKPEQSALELIQSRVGDITGRRLNNQEMRIMFSELAKNR